MGVVGQSSDWCFLKISSLSFMSFHVQGGEFCRDHDVTSRLPFLTLQNYWIFPKLPKLYKGYLYLFHILLQNPPPFLTYVKPSIDFAHLSWNGNNAILVGKASFLLPSSPRVFCPLLSYSLSSVSLREFFGVAHLITYCCRTDYRLLQERSPAILSCHGKTRASSVLRMAYRIFPFFMRSFFWLFAFGFLFNMRFCEKDTLKSWWNLDFDVAVS